MKKFESIFNKLSPTIGKLTANKTLQGISASMMGLFPITIIGSLCLLVFCIGGAVAPLGDFLTSSGIGALLIKANSLTIGALAVYVVVLIGKNVAKMYDPKDDGISAAVISLLGFLLLTPLGATAEGATYIPTTWLGATGIFSAMIIGIVSARLYVWMRQKGWTIKMPEGVPPMVAKVFESLIPAILIGVFFLVVSFVFTNTTYGSMHQAIYSIIQIPLQGIGGNIWAMCIFTIVAQALWFFGIHGNNVVGPIYTPIWLALDAANMAAVAAGNAPQNIIGMAFFNTFTFGGMVLGLVFMMSFMSKSKQYKSLGRLSLMPAIFGVTEPVIFGTPLVLNFIFAIPFIFGNVIALLIAYFATTIGLVPVLNGIQTIFGLPVGLFAAIQGSWQIVVLQLAIVVIIGCVWYPFFKIADRNACKQEAEALQMNEKA